MNSLVNMLEENEKFIQDEENKKRDVVINLVKRLYLELDIYSDTLIYIWLDNNRIKINMDGANSRFNIKKNTKFDINSQVDIKSPIFIDYLKQSVENFLAKRGISIYNFYFDSQKLIFKIKTFKKMDLEKCLY